MKKLNKLQINHEKLMNNEELLKLKGGYDGCGCLCYNWEFQLIGAIQSDALHCNPDCIGWFGGGFGHGIVFKGIL